MTFPQTDNQPNFLRGASLVFDRVSFGYNDFRPIFNELSLNIEPGSFVALVGANGSGKSTFALLAAGLLIPQSGEIALEPSPHPRQTPDKSSSKECEKETTGLSAPISQKPHEIPSEPNARVGIVFQNPDDQLLASLVEDEVAFGPANLGVSREELKRRTREALEVVGLTPFAHAAVASLSGGQRQRLALAGALALHPSLLILDEATSMIDPQGRNNLLKLCKTLHKQGLTIILITQDMEEAFYAQRVMVLHEGAVVIDGACETVLSQEKRLIEAGLESPFAWLFSKRLREHGVSIPLCHDGQTLEENLCTLYYTR